MGILAWAMLNRNVIFHLTAPLRNRLRSRSQMALFIFSSHSVIKRLTCCLSESGCKATSLHSLHQPYHPTNPPTLPSPPLPQRECSSPGCTWPRGASPGPDELITLGRGRFYCVRGPLWRCPSVKRFETARWTNIFSPSPSLPIKLMAC